MILPKFSVDLRSITKVFLLVILSAFFVLILVLVYVLGLVSGYDIGQNDTEKYFLSLVNQKSLNPTPTITREVFPTQALTPKPTKLNVSWGGPELWEAVNAKRVELGVNPLKTRSELCTVASIRLNELLELGKLDNHEGFSNLPERRPDLKWIFDDYSTIAEFLAVGGKTPEETVSLWLNALGHRKLLDGGEYVWGCIYAQNTFAVAITAF
ncbi:hypothetical protein A2962_02140 [Candidatus Woesebacteria bacterium RIFCSPLOWO2_01_FULL_39_61]|uniref:SCP domain-containing protein n=1 Tax=Candidatus Woesebacteria bacterium RIFCSPHIGHO2_02_FULL_39_13 TaxID=1802505 RepID=A0A1F7Z302_9BACT|nr:MAG: hypothetical protein A2692_01155 [Candidatus Woesebacteria bacterium RIFCSPHIGHO2_01_FULL_39_95]OGM33962.1 MAG: hypothetical protein A3D01_03445 [Candidatus Woesebacteria bacterium RIFCSPHIGHO2_02_FULL_39_13]OGM38220.1 MAG: hypothetical protein A3E13_05555 [Candidatus Woesebacteria bacterium RIFCSPHIGHO2_12_FULL_40_20]OGM66926.1 MAG: hypothetical protein A2962_02140 [Candidatus Woesebacteria bacterium RIFCSPLOWO2_01_FULL_39_61]OGM72318.1 MAG: hypothetical protein A3H19_03410 [Candidatus